MKLTYSVAWIIPPLEIAFEMAPKAGDIYGGEKFGKEISSTVGHVTQRWRR